MDGSGSRDLELHAVPSSPEAYHCRSFLLHSFHGSWFATPFEMPYKECNKTGGNGHVCKCIEYLHQLIENTTKGEGAKVRANISANESSMQQLRTATTTTSQIRVSMGTIGVHGAAINASFIRAHVVPYKPTCKLH